MENAAIVARHISKNFGNHDAIVRALDNVSLSIARGEFVMITGKNGSGKSTLLHQLGLLDRPDKGDVLINGQEVAHVKERTRNTLRLRHLGYIFQEYALIAELSALENVMLPAMMIMSTAEAKKRAAELLAMVGLGKKMKRLPPELSGGEQQKVAIARALVNKPSILFADEPTANLDTKASLDVLKIFSNLNKNEGYTIVMVTHEQEELVYASRIIQLSDGKLKQ